MGHIGVPKRPANVPVGGVEILFGMDCEQRGQEADRLSKYWKNGGSKSKAVDIK